MPKITSVRIENDHTEEVIAAMNEQVLVALRSIGQTAEGHGESGSYTIILNRTKVIFKGE
jgi:hypothetical protein